MVLDTSAIIASITGQLAVSRGDARRRQLVDFFGRRFGNQDCSFARLGLDAVGLFEELLQNAGIVIVPFDDEMARVAFDAFRRYGKGQTHPAQLNIVDCAVYALAKVRSQPLLFKGDDFDRTDIHSALV